LASTLRSSSSSKRTNEHVIEAPQHDPVIRTGRDISVFKRRQDDVDNHPGKRRRPPSMPRSELLYHWADCVFLQLELFEIQFAVGMQSVGKYDHIHSTAKRRAEAVEYTEHVRSFRSVPFTEGLLGCLLNGFAKRQYGPPVGEQVLHRRPLRRSRRHRAIEQRLGIRCVADALNSPAADQSGNNALGLPCCGA
jgi:hypothetical protein